MDTAQFTGSRKLAAAALILAFLAVPFFFLFYVSIPLGAIAVLLALLSRGSGKISPRAKLAAIIGTGAICLSLLTTAYMFITVYRTPELRTQIEQMIDFYYDLYDMEENDSSRPKSGDSYRIPGLDNEPYYEELLPSQEFTGGEQI